MNRLALRVLADPVGAVAGPEARGLPAAHRQLERDVVDLRVVDAARRRPRSAAPALSPRLGVARPDRRLQPVRALVGELDRLVGVGDLHHRQRRAERLLAPCSASSGRRRPAPWARRSARRRPRPRLPPVIDPRALGDRVADVRLDQLDLRREDDRPDVHRARGRRAGPGGAPRPCRATRSRKSS